MNLKKTPLAFIILGLYLIASGYFAFERILNTDNSFFFFQIIDKHDFWFPENRSGVFISQLPLLLFSHLGLSLTSLVYIYSLTFPLEYIAIAAICQYYLKVKEASLAIAFCLIFGVAYSFMHPVTETYHALVFSVLLYAVLVSEIFIHKNWKYYFSVLAVTILCIISHPIAVFTIGFVALFASINKQIKITPALFVIGLAGTSMLLRVLFVPKGSYDVQQYDNLFASLKSLNEFGNLYPILYIKSRCNSVYFSTILLISVFGVLAIKSKQKTIFSTGLLAALGFAVIGVLTFSKGDADMMMEKTFMPAIFMMVLPFCYLFFHQNVFEKTTLTIVVSLLTVFSFSQIIKATRTATERLNALQQIADQSTQPKIIADFSDFDNQSLHFNHWNTGIDSYILAKSKLNKSFTLFLVDDKRNFVFDSSNVDLFLGPTWWPMWNNKEMDSTYFYFPSPYVRFEENMMTR